MEIIKTRDGEMDVEKVVAFSHQVLVAMRNSFPRGSAENQKLHALVLALEKGGPDSYSFAATDSPAAKVFVDAFTKIRVKCDGLFVPLTKAREEAVSYQEKRAETAAERALKLEEQRVKDVVEAGKRIVAKRAAAQQKQEERAAALDALDVLVPDEVKTELAEKRAEDKDKRDLRDLYLRPIVEGRSCVVLEEGSRGRVIGLAYETPGPKGQGVPHEVGTVDWVALEEKAAKAFAPLNLGDPVEMIAALQKLEVDCLICEDKMVLGQAQILKVVAYRPDWSDLWVYPKNHPLAGQAVEHRLLVCFSCAKHARDIAPNRPIKAADGTTKQVKAARFAACFERPGATYKDGKPRTGGEYERYYSSLKARHYTGETGGKGMISGPAPALTHRFNPEDMAAAQAAVEAAGRAKSPEELANEAVDADSAKTE